MAGLAQAGSAFFRSGRHPVCRRAGLPSPAERTRGIRAAFGSSQAVEIAGACSGRQV